MKTTTLLLLMTVLTAVACKKSKDPEPILETVFTTVETYDKFSGVNETAFVWYTHDGDDGHRSMKEIAANKTFQSQTYFGRYKSEQEEDGLYAPTAYPVLYGQQNWAIQNKTIFRKPAFTEKEFNELVDEDYLKVNAAFIEKAFKESTVIGDKVTNVLQGDVFVFESMGGKVKGVVRATGYYQQGKYLKLEVWVK
jgi:hypothetical protein